MSERQVFRPPRYLVLLLGLSLAGACDGGPAAPPDPASGSDVRLQAVAGQDTIEAWLGGGVSVSALRRDGSAVRGVRLSFRVIGGVPVQLAGGGSPPTSAGDAVTDVTGRAAVSVLLGTRAGEARIEASAPEVHWTDTVTVTVLPGHSVGATSSLKADSAVTVGAAFTVTASAIDRRGNPCDGPVTFSSGNPAILQVDAGGRVTALGPGRGWLAITVTTYAGQLAWAGHYLSVVPPGTLAITPQPDSGVVVVATDGSAPVTLRIGRVLYPAWSRDGRRLVYSNGVGLAIVDAASGRVEALPTVGVESAAWPEFGPGDTWVYFDGLQGGGHRIFRVRPDGSGLERLTDEEATAPSPAPDGTRVAYAAPDGLRVLDLATRSSRLVFASSAALTPRWSPDGAAITFLDQWRVTTVEADGSSPRLLGYSYDPGLTWSPDGAWVAWVYNGTVALAGRNTVNASFRIPTLDPMNVAWRP